MIHFDQLSRAAAAGNACAICLFHKHTTKVTLISTSHNKISIQQHLYFKLHCVLCIIFMEKFIVVNDYKNE